MAGVGRPAALAALIAGSVAAGEPPPALIEATEEASAQCRELGGVPSIMPDYQIVRDLNGDGHDDFLTDLAHLQCAGAWSAFCGSAGCPVTAWLSGPGGYTRFDFGYLQGLELRDGTGALPELVAYYHGTRCEDDRVGAEGCTRTWTFSGNAPDEPPVDAAATAAREVGADAVAAPEELPSGWTLRQVPGSSPVALAAGPGNIASLAAFCLSDQPFLAVTFHRRPAADQATMDFSFSPPVAASAGFEKTAGGAFVIALADLPLVARLAGRDREVAVAVDGRAEGVLSLKGSTRALRTSLGECYRF